MKLSREQTEYRIISNSIFLRIIISKFMKIWQLFHVKNVCKNVNNQHVQNGRTDFFLSQLSNCYTFQIVHNCIRNHHTEFEISRTILTYLN